MEETTYLKQKIKDCRHKLNLAKILENCVYYISFGALAAVLVEAFLCLSRFTMRTILQQAV